jgi:hypothetical protein
MDVTSPETATLGIWTIARFAALAVLATEALFLWTRRRDAALQGRASARFFWAVIPAVLLAGLCLWCSNFVAAARHAPGPVVAQLSR